jgi:hypothetical protein
MDKPPVVFPWNLVRNRAGPRHVGAPLHRHSLNIFGREKRRTILRARAQISDNFWRNSFTYGKPEFTSTIFPIIPVMSYRPIEVGTPGTIGPSFIPALVRKFFTKICLSDATFVNIGAVSYTLLMGANIFLPLHSIYLDRSRWNSVSAIFLCYWLSVVTFVKVVAVKSNFTWGRKWNFSRTSYISRPIWTKFGIGNVYKNRAIASFVKICSVLAIFYLEV